MRGLRAATAVIVGGLAVGAAVGGSPGPAAAAGADGAAAPGLALPAMNPQHGKEIFVRKGCVVCHAVNGIGGADGLPLDAATMDPAGNPFEFFARMLAGMAPMLAMQDNRLGGQIELTTEELGDLVAFIHDAAAQKTLSKGDIPEDIKKLMEND